MPECGEVVLGQGAPRCASVGCFGGLLLLRAFKACSVCWGEGSVRPLAILAKNYMQWRQRSAMQPMLLCCCSEP